MRRMQARYSGFCRRCKQRISVGEPIVFIGKKNTYHARCFDGIPEDEQQKIAAPPRGNRPKTSDDGLNVFSVDWSELKQNLLAAFRGDFKSFPKHERHVKSHLVSPDNYWQGYSGSDAQRWLEKGYETDAIKGLGDFSPPLREKRKYRYAEEGDEFHYDLAASGDERFMGTWTKRDSIPGASVQVALGFSAAVNASVLNEYAAWVCKAIYALDLAGIDTEISIHYKAVDVIQGQNTPTDTRVRVKKENEVVDFHSFSAMFSPAQFRAYMFAAMYLHAESLGKTITSGHGHSPFFKDWGVRWDADEQKLFIDCDYGGSPFPTERMELQLRQALKDMTGKS